MKPTRLLSITAATVFALLAIPTGLAAQSASGEAKAKSYIVSFDVPNAGTGAYQGTYVDTVNLEGVITGYYLDGNNVYHGFLRSPNGSFATFDAPGADTNPGDFNGTLPVSLNDLGVITGVYYDTSSVGHGFLRSPDGNFTTFDPPGAGSSGIIVHALNLEGAVVGSYLDAALEYHAFLRSPDGTFTTFEAPGACNGGLPAGCHGTGGWDINLFGTIVGAYEDTSGNFVAHTFIRTPDGNFTTFSVPGSSKEAGQGTLPASTSGLNDFGAITGNYYDANNVLHGYLRNPNRTFIKFEAPGADTMDAFYGTFPASLNDVGAITGSYLDASGVYHGFLRAPNNKFTSFDAPGADLNPGDFNGTYPASINLFGAITGSYQDVNFVYHGFIQIPCGGDRACSEDKGIGTAAQVTSPPTIQGPTNADRVNRNRGLTSPIQHRFGDRSTPWYRGVEGQPSK